MFRKLLHKLKILMQIQENIKIGTHDGPFHCDQVLACLLLTKFSNKYKGAQIIRTRDQKILSQCQIIVDVGGKYQPPKYFDHHQRQFTGTHPNYTIKLSSAGLVYLHFTQLIPNIIKYIVQNVKTPFQVKVNPQIQQQIRNKVYQTFILSVDANDNGVQICQKKNQTYKVTSALWNRIARCNPMWWQQQVNQFQRFLLAMKIAEQEMIAQVKGMLLGYIQTYQIILELFKQRFNYHKSGEIVILKQYMPWQQAIFKVEKQLNLIGNTKYVLYPEKNSTGWRVQAVSSHQGAFSLRKGLKQQWRGVKQMDELRKISGIEDIVFVHVSGFIGGAKSFESTLRMAQLSL